MHGDLDWLLFMERPSIASAAAAHLPPGRREELDDEAAAYVAGKEVRRRMFQCLFCNKNAHKKRAAGCWNPDV